MAAPEDAVEFRILGPLEASRHGQPLELGAGKQRALLVLLSRGRDRVDGSLDRCRFERPPPSALNSVHIYVSQLRKALGNGRLETHGRGYLLALEPEQLDLGRFERLLVTVELLASGDADRAAGALRAALGLWRGPPLSDVAFEPFAQAEIARLDELRLALEERIEADLARRRHAELVPELEGLVREHPLRERLRAQLMLALYRSGRQSEALDAYQQARKLLSTELGRAGPQTTRARGRDPAAKTRSFMCPRDPPDGPERFTARGVASSRSEPHSCWRRRLPGRHHVHRWRDPTPPRVLPNSLVRVDPDTLEATNVVRRRERTRPRRGRRWVRLDHPPQGRWFDRVRDAGDRTLKRRPGDRRGRDRGRQARAVRARPGSVRRCMGRELLRVWR